MARTGTAKQAPQPQLTGIQSLRGIAALLVILCHAQLWQGKNFPTVTLVPFQLFFGEAGVDIFFVISGFIMMYVTPKSFVSWRNQASFLVRRFTRIYPTYWAIVIPIILFWFVHPEEVNRSQGNHVNVLTSILLLPDKYSPALGVAWTLVFELFFYVVASFIFYGDGPKRLVATLIWFSIIAAATMLHPAVIQNPWLHVWLSPLSLEFISGMLLAYALQRGSFSINPWIAGWVVLLSWGTIIFSGLHHGGYTGNGESYIRIFTYGVPAVLIVWMMLQMELQNRWTWFKAIAPLGDRSYSAYLLHLPLLAAMLRVAGIRFPHAGYGEVLAMTIGAVVLLSIPIELCYRFIEKPSHTWGKILASHLQAPRAVPNLSLLQSKAVIPPNKPFP